MIEVVIRESWVEYAKKNYSGDRYNQNTILPAGRGQFAGIIGECAVGRYFLDYGIDFEYEARESYQYDFDLSGYKIDVKSKFSVGVPKPDYVVRIPHYQKRQQCDIYIFTYVTESRVWILGWMDKSDFWFSSESTKAGDNRSGIEEKADCNFIEISALKPMQDLELKFIPF